MSNISNDEWFDIPGYEGLYSITKNGKVRSETRYVFQQGRKQIKRGKVLKPWISTTGYKVVGLCKNGKSKKGFIHILVALTFIGERPPKMDIRHLDGNKFNNSVENLAYGTRSQNMLDAVKHHTSSCDRYNPNNIFKLTEKQAIEIAKDTRPSKVIAAEYGITDRHVTSIKRGEYWGDVTKGIRVKSQVTSWRKRIFTQNEINEICNKNNSRKYLMEKFNCSVDVIQRVRKENIIKR